MQRKQIVSRLITVLVILAQVLAGVSGALPPQVALAAPAAASVERTVKPNVAAVPAPERAQAAQPIKAAAAPAPARQVEARPLAYSAADTRAPEVARPARPQSVAAAPLAQGAPAIGNTVWKDTNGNGLQDSGEPGIPGVTVELYEANGNAAMCPQAGWYDTYREEFSTTANTNSNGTLDWTTKAWVHNGTTILGNFGNPGGTLQIYAASSGYYATRAVDLSVFTSNPTLRFDYNMAGTAAKFNILYSNNGGTSFTQLAVLSDNNNGYKTITYTLPITVANAQIRIQGQGTGNLGYFDNLTIQGQIRHPMTAVTDSNGRYTFPSANCIQPSTNYQMRIDTTQKALFGFTLAPLNAGGVTSNDPTSDTSDSDASSLMINAVPYAVINFTSPATGGNNSYAFGFLSTPVGTLQVNKTVNGAAAPAGWGFTLSSANCFLPPGLTNPSTTTTGAGGSVTFANLLVQDGVGTACEYQVNEKSQTGWFLNYLTSDPVTGIKLTANSTTVVAVVNSQPQTCNAGNGDVGGLVFQDFNMDGQQNSTTNELGFTGAILVRAYGKDNQLLASTSLQADGSYLFKNLPNLTTDGVRIEFQNPAATGVEPTTYMAAASTTNRVSKGLVRFVKAATCNVDLGVNSPPNYCQANPQVAMVPDNLVATNPSMVEVPYTASGTQINNTTSGQTGSIWGLAYQKSTNTIFMGAFYKPGWGFGPLGSGGIYTYNRTTKAFSSFVDLQTLGIQTGPTIGLIPVNDVGKLSLGDVDISEDNKTLYIMNMYQRELVLLDIASKSVTQHVPVPDPGCMAAGKPAPQDRQPWGIAVHNGAAYVGITCSAETSGLASDLHHYVMKLQGNTFVPFFDFPSTRQGKYVDFHAWVDAYSPTEPILADFAFDTDGSLALATSDRNGYKWSTETHGTGGVGVLARACNVNGTLVFEGGPGCRAKYYTEYGWGTVAGVALAPGTGEVLSTALFSEGNAQGVGWFNNATGISQRTQIVSQSFGKATGVGDVEALCDPAPLEIGNRVWNDSTRPNGVQDPNEPGIAGVIVGLYNITGTLVATTTTSALGEYVFNKTNVAGGLKENTDYTIRINRTQPPLTNLIPAALNQVLNNASTPDEHDSDGNPATNAGYVTAVVRTGSVGQNDYSYDFGFSGAEIGNYVWRDSNSDGKQDANEPGLAGVTVGLYDGSGNAVLCGSNNTPVTTLTDASGHYTFTGTSCVLPSTAYRIGVDPVQTALLGFQLTTPNAGGVTSNDSTADDSDSDATLQTLGGKTVAVINGTSPAAGANYSYDFGFIPLVIGNYVWKDTNVDGKQDSGEPGIPGVTVGLYDASGNAVMCPQVGRYDTYADAFNSGVANGSTGNLTWSTTWSFAGSAATSTAQGNPGGSMYVYGATTSTAARTVNLSVFAGPPTLSFDYIRGNGAASFNVQYSSNGGTSFTTLATLSVNNASYQTINYTLPITAANAQIRIQGVTGGTAVYAYFDNVTVQGQIRYPVTSVTDANGIYTFTGANCVQPNTNYQVQIDMTQTPLVGLLQTTQNAGGVTSNDPTADDSDSDASRVTLSGKANAVINLTAPASGVNYSYDFGFVPVEIGNYVWKDTNLNGLQESDEPGVAGVTVGLYDSSGNAALCLQSSTANLALNKTATQVSDYTSAYLASNGVDGNTASGMFITGSSANSWWQVDLGLSAIVRQVVLYPRPDGISPAQGQQIYVLVSNQPFASTNLATTLADPNVWHSTLQGAWTGASLTIAVPNYTGRYVRIQHNNTDFLSLGEVQVFGDPMPLVTSITDSSGHYTFTGASCLQPSTAYQVRIATDQMALRGLYPTTPNAGGVTSNNPTGDDNDSDATSLTLNNTIYARTVLTSPAGGLNYSYDFGFVPVEIGNYVWKDTNTNGIQESGEPGIPNVTLNLYRNNAPVSCVQDQTRYYLDTGAGTTDSAGTLNWAGQAWTFNNAGTNTGGNPGNTVYVYGYGTATRAVDLSVFGGYPTVSYDYAYINTAAGYSHVVEYSTDGGATWQTALTHSISSGATYQAASFTLPSFSANTVIRIRGTGGTNGNWLRIDNLRIEGLVAAPATAVTDSAGRYSFDGRCVQPNTTYQVMLDTTQSAVKGLYVTKPNAGGVTSNDPTADDSDSDAITTTLNYKTWAVINATAPAVGANLSYDFGLVEVGIGNFVWKDTNANGLQDSGEPDIAGLPVTLYNPNGTPVMCVYDQSADYLDTGASATDSAGSLNWAGQAWTFSSAGTTTGGNPGNMVYIYGNGTATRAVDLSVFGEYPTLSYDYAYGNTTTGYSHVVEYSTNGGTTWQTLATYTPSSGAAYQTASFTLPTLSATARIRIRGTVGTTANYLRIDNLHIAGGIGEPVATVTDISGYYNFTGADCVQPNGQYQVRIDRMNALLRGLSLTTPNAGGVTSNDPTLDDNDSEATATTINGMPYAVVNATAPAVGINPSYDFGFVEVGIGNYVWRDTNTDGVQDANEPGIGGVTVGLYDASGNPVLCVQDQTKDYLDTGASTTDSAGSLDWSSKAWTFSSAGTTTTGGNPGNTVYVYGNGSAVRAVDLSVFGAYPTLSYSYAYVNTTTGYSHVVEYSTDGGTTWQAVATYTDSAGTAYQSVNFTLPTLSANARIRIRGTAGTTANYLRIDNLRIVGGVATQALSVTDVNGYYGFDGRCVQPNTAYQVRIDMQQTLLTSLYVTTQNAGGVTSNNPTADDTDSDTSMVTISGKANAVISLTSPAAGLNNSYDFGFMPVEIGNYVWKDSNTNGRQDASEPGIPGVTVGLYDASGNAVMCPQAGRYDTYADTFDGGGSTGSLNWGTTWSFAGSAATYGAQGNPGGSIYVYGATTSTAARTVDLSVFAGSPTLSFDYIRGNGAATFNVQYSTNGGTSFTTLATLSVNNASYQTINYTLPITAANAQIRIQGATGGGSVYAYFDNLTIQGQVRYPATAVTDSYGLYTFTRAQCVQPSTNYQVRIDTTQDALFGFFLTGQNAGGVTSNNPTADDTDSDASTVTINGKANAVISLTAPATGVNYSYDFGFIPVEIGNYVWKDRNTNGRQDSGEPGIAGVTVGLYDASGNQMQCKQMGRYDTYRDEFSTTANTNSNGTLDWSSKAWVQTGTSILSNSGNPGGALQVYGASAAYYATRAVDLSIFTGNPTLRFDYNMAGTASKFNIQYSANGGTSFTTLAVLSDNNSTYKTITYTLPITVANAQIRIQGQGTGNWAYFDNLTLRGQVRYPVTTVTDVNGLYTFTGAQCVQPSTSYQVRIDTTQAALRGLFPTSQNVGGVTSNDPTADDNDSDASTVTLSGKATAVINATAPAAGVNYSYDFGFVPVEIGNYVWRDDNLNGRQDAGEPGIPGVTVGLYNASGNLVQCPPLGQYNTYADAFNSGVANGSTGNLTWGTTWSFAGSAATYGTQGNPGGSMYVYATTTSTAARAVDLSIFAGPPTLRFDYIQGNGPASFNVQYSSNGGTSFTTLATLNVNNTSYKTITYTLPITVANAQIRLQGATGGGSVYAYFDNVTIQGQPPAAVTTVTDANGLYTFTGAQCVQPSTSYQVRIDTTQTVLHGLFPTTPNAGGVTSNDPTADDNDSDASTVTLNGKANAVINVTAPAAGANYSYDFGFVPVLIGNYVWKDSNADGLQTAGEPPIAGVTVGLYDSSGNAVMCTQANRYDTYQDSFNTAGVNNGTTGTLAWSTSWVQSNTAVVGTNGNPGGSLRMYSAASYYATRAVDLSVFASAPTLRLDYNFGGAALSFAIQSSVDNGSTFQTLATLSGNNSTYQTISYTLPSNAATAQIRIQGLSGGNYAYFDNITLQGQMLYPVTTVTAANGLYSFSGAECLEPTTAYQVRIATLQNPLFGLVLTKPNAGGVTSNDPTGDDSDSDASGVTLNGIPYAVTTLTSPAVGANYSYDYGFVPSPVGAIQVNKTVNGAAAPAGWGFTLSSANCLLPPGLTNPITTTNGAGGSVTFANLLVKDGAGAACQYQVSEKSQNGWFLNYVASDPVTGIKVTANSTTAVAIVNSQPQTCNVGSGNVGGLVFQDFDMDGQQNSTTSEGGYLDGVIAVRAYGKNNQLLASVPLQPDGSYVFTNLPNLTTDGVRIEFQNLTAAGVEPTTYTAIASTANRTSKGNVRFVKAATCNVDLGVNRPVNYCQANPWVAVPTNFVDGALNGTATLRAFPYQSPTGTTLAANYAQIGATWGEAYQASTKTLFVAAFTREYVDYGPLGRGGIYAVNMSNPAARQVTSFVDLQTLGVNAGGTGPRPTSVDAEVGNSSLGDIDISEDGKTLYIMNLYKRELVALDIAAKTVTAKIPVPEALCLDSRTSTPVSAPQDRRPWAVKVHNGEVYIGVACTAQTSGLPQDLRAHILRLNGDHFESFYAFTLGPSTGAAGFNINPEPWPNTNLEALIADIEFRSDGSLLIGMANRSSWTSAYYYHQHRGGAFIVNKVNGVFATSPSLYYLYSTTYGTALVGAGLAYKPDADTLLTTGWAGGPNVVDWFNPDQPVWTRNLPIPLGEAGAVNKSLGLGDLEILCDPAPLEIGNRVWNDSIQPNGVQDPNEPGISGVIVGLYNITGTLVATTTTNAVGEYTFNKNNVPNGLKENTNYTIRINRTQTPLANLTPTLLNQLLNNPIDPDEHDSDGNQSIYAGYVTTPVRTGSAGQNDYSFDFGFTTARYDWGDNPDKGTSGTTSYNTVMTNTGAIHVIVPGLRLGATEDGEINGQPNNTATGDGADEDGVRFPPLKANSTAFITVTATNTGTTAATLYSWIDFNGDGQFSPNERMSTNVPAGTNNGVFFVIYYVPANAVSDTYARFRLSTDPAAAEPTGVAFDGEVEDYSVAIQAFVPAQFGDRVWLESDTDGLANTGTVVPVAGMVITASNILQAYTATTNSQGYYSFTVPAGTYAVRYGSVPASYGAVTPSATPGGNSVTGNAGSYQQTGNPDQSHANGTTVTVGDNEANWQVDFAFNIQAQIGDRVWIESDSDGDATTGTVTPVVGQVVTATSSSKVVYTAVTDANGLYTLTVPANDVYTVTTGVPVGTVPSIVSTSVANDSNAAANDNKNHLNTGTSVTVTTQNNASVDFGFHPALVQFGDRVWLESDADGLAGTGVITPVVGMVITATAGANTYTATTDSQGYYSFTVAPAFYTVSYGSVPASYGVVLPSATPGGNTVQGNAGSYREAGNPDASHANATTVNLVDGEANWQVDFAFHAPHADLHLVKQVNKTVAKSGDTAVYTLVLTNNGPDTATNVSVNDLLPATVLYQSATAQQGAYDANTGEWTVGTLPVNSSVTLTITVKIR